MNFRFGHIGKGWEGRDMRLGDHATEPSVDGAAIFYFNKRPGANPTDRREIREKLGAVPFVSARSYTEHGVGAVVTLPLTMSDLLRDRDAARGHINRAIGVARDHGARCVALSGLLAALADYGELVAPSWTDIGVTTGHATATACIILAIESLLHLSGRDWSAERVAILGTGSIGLSVLAAALARLGSPHEVIVCDLATRREAVESLLSGLRAGHPEVRYEFCATDRDDRPLYDASFIVGSASAPNILDVRRVAPGCLIVDDSVPHCFSVEVAKDRALTDGDVLFTYGGSAMLRKPFEIHTTAPEVLLERDGWPTGRSSAQEMPGCILSPLVHLAAEHLPPTVGKGVPAEETHRHLAFMNGEGMTPTSPQIGGFVFAEEAIERFRSRHRRTPPRQGEPRPLGERGGLRPGRRDPAT
ncbi:hypothetical protein [Streptomyces sp. B6B3]|uniref:hypothetical protein n=1 Tax=Streptomyces sp. B6B3 TaxID=3153570 RepID=UPI00325DB782